MPVANESLPFFSDNDDATFKANAAVTGCRFLRIAANKDANGNYVCDHANTAGQNIIGVSAWDVASGALGIARRRGEYQVLAGEALVAGDAVATSATGAAVKLATAGAGAVRVGICTTATSNAALAPILLTI